MNLLYPEKPAYNKDMLVSIALTAAITRPAASGNFRGTSTGKLMDHTDSGNKDDNEEDEDYPLVMIDKSKKSSITLELAGDKVNLRRA